MTRQTNAQHDTLCNKTTCTTHDTWNLIASNLMHAIFFESERAKCTFPQKCHSGKNLGIVSLWFELANTSFDRQQCYHLRSPWLSQMLCISMHATCYANAEAALPARSVTLPLMVAPLPKDPTSKIRHGPWASLGTALATLGCPTTKWMPRIWEPFRLVLTPLWGHGPPKS